MLEIGAGGETLVAYIRVAILAILLILPGISSIFSTAPFEATAGATGLTIALLISFYWLKLTKHEPRPVWLPFATTASDVTSVSLVLILLTMVNPSAGANSIVTWLCYPLSIMTTALRNDIRVTLFAGALAFIQFGILLLYIFSMPKHMLFSAQYGAVDLSNSMQRLIVLLVFTLSTALIVYRMQRLVTISGTDALTGLHNRMYLNENVPRLIRIAQRKQSPLSVAIIDIDFFKAINDQLGHSVGDAALKHTVSIIGSCLQAGESLSRIGGEEFLYVAKTDPATAFQRLDAIREKMAGSPFLVEDGSTRMITISAGIASYPETAETLSALLKAADKRLRQAKQNGRNCVVHTDVIS